MSENKWSEKYNVISFLKGKLNVLWKNNTLLTDAADGAYHTYSFTIPRPKPQDLKNNLGEIYRWCREINKCTENGLLRITTCEIRNCGVGGKQKIPRTVEIELQKALELLGKEEDAKTYLKLLAETEDRLPKLAPYIKSKPHYFLSIANRWAQCLNVCNWMLGHPKPNIFLREADIPGVDTKFIEKNKALLVQLFEVILPDSAKNLQATADVAHFEERYGFLQKSDTIRLRLPLGCARFPSTISDIRLLVEELENTAIPCSEVAIVENEITFLTVPRRENRLVIWGMGYADVLLESISWLNDKRILYWGDIDTHGFKILSNLRKYFPHTESIFMNKATLEAYLEKGMCVEEDVPVREVPDYLNKQEKDTFKSLYRNGKHLRLEQEKIRGDYIRGLI